MIKNKVIFLLLLSFAGTAIAQAPTSGLVAQYSFNGGNANDDIGPYNGTPVNATLTTDRFGNPNAAYHFNGTLNSYLKLGTNAALKPVVGSISLWAKIDTIITAGSGYSYNPLILTKCQSGNSFYEAYCLYYDFSSKKIRTVATKPPATQVFFDSNSPVSQNVWHHLVVTYDNNTISLYVDDILQSTQTKTFSTVFLASDSVVVASSANTQNKRYFKGSIDDICIYNRVLSQAGIDSLFYAPNTFTGINQLTQPAYIELYPNPARGSFVVKIDREVENCNLVLTNSIGQKVYEQRMTQGYNTINLGTIKDGVLYYSISVNRQTIQQGKLLVSQ